MLEKTFAHEPGRSLQDYYRAMAERYKADDNR